MESIWICLYLFFHPLRGLNLKLPDIFHFVTIPLSGHSQYKTGRSIRKISTLQHSFYSLFLSFALVYYDKNLSTEQSFSLSAFFLTSFNNGARSFSLPYNVRSAFSSIHWAGSLCPARTLQCVRPCSTCAAAAVRHSSLTGNLRERNSSFSWGGRGWMSDN